MDYNHACLSMFQMLITLCDMVIIGDTSVDDALAEMEFSLKMRARDPEVPAFAVNWANEIFNELRYSLGR